MWVGTSCGASLRLWLFGPIGERAGVEDIEGVDGVFEGAGGGRGVGVQCGRGEGVRPFQGRRVIFDRFPVVRCATTG
jgi:hypothetical protein